MSKFLTIGNVAKQSNLPVKTIRYYADLGLLSPHLSRERNGYRLFSASVFQRLNFIRRSQSLGLTLKEIEQILSVYDQKKIPCNIAKQLLQDKLKEIELKISELNLLKDELNDVLSGWQEINNFDGVKEHICPNLIATYYLSNE